MRTFVLKAEVLTGLAGDDPRRAVGAVAAASLPATVCVRDLLREFECYSWQTEQC